MPPPWGRAHLGRCAPSGGRASARLPTSVVPVSVPRCGGGGRVSAARPRPDTSVGAAPERETEEGVAATGSAAANASHHRRRRLPPPPLPPSPTPAAVAHGPSQRTANPLAAQPSAPSPRPPSTWPASTTRTGRPGGLLGRPRAAANAAAEVDCSREEARRCRWGGNERRVADAPPGTGAPQRGGGRRRVWDASRWQRANSSRAGPPWPSTTSLARARGARTARGWSGNDGTPASRGHGAAGGWRGTAGYGGRRQAARAAVVVAATAGRWVGRWPGPATARPLPRPGGGGSGRASGWGGGGTRPCQ